MHVCTDVGGIMQLIRGWMWGLVARETAPGGEDRMDKGDEAELVRGVSRLLAEILAKLEAGLGGTPLDVEISYEMEDDVRSHLLALYMLGAAGCCKVLLLMVGTRMQFQGLADWDRGGDGFLGVSKVKSLRAAQESLPGGDTQIDIEVDADLAPALPAHFLDERLRALSRSLNRQTPALPA